MTRPIHNHFGMSGQDAAYDAFLCFGAKCKRRKRERHKARMAKRESKTDERRAETERTRAETSIMKAMAQQPASLATPASRAVAAPTLIQAAPATAPQVAQAGLGSNKLMMVVGLLLVAGFVYNNMQKKKVAGPGAVPPVPNVKPVPQAAI